MFKIAIKIAQQYENSFIVNKQWLDRRDKIKKNNEGKTFFAHNGGMPKLMYEGKGLEKFKDFKDLDQFKNPDGMDGNFVNNIKKLEKKHDITDDQIARE